MPMTIINDGNSKTVHTQEGGQKTFSIRNLNGFKFEVPPYQRGFRWTRQQIKELIDDLYIFCAENSNKDKQYCLQNVTVRMKKNTGGEEIYEVVDGQQRLTAIWILIMACLTISYAKKKLEDLPIYSINYEGKDGLSCYVENITKEAKSSPGNCEILNIQHPNDIDSSYIYDAFKFIIDDYKYLNNGKDICYDDILVKIFTEVFFNPSRDIVIIWNQIVPPNAEDESEKTKYVIERFSNLNANKIPLTESELIKAYFIDKLESERGKECVSEFTLQWEEIERGLNNDDFWYFITSGEYFETRTDLLFQILLGNGISEDGNGQHNLSRQINNEIMRESGYFVWKEIVQIYETLLDWFNDYYYYHVIGLLIAINNRKSSLVIKELYDEYKQVDKDVFQSSLKKKIFDHKLYSIPFSRIDKLEETEADDILLDGEGDDEISYEKKKECVKPILLLFNISLLVNAYMENKENATERFPFKIYKSHSNPIEIEHINPQVLEKGSDTQDEFKEKQEKWAKATIAIIDDKKTQIEFEKKLEKNKISKEMIKEIERAANLNALSNLTLLDKYLNSSYGNECFKDKRNSILAARFGNPIPLKTGDKIYKQSVIFPGTMWVFMRQYKDAEGNSIRWDSTDRKEYVKCMQDSISSFLKK